MMKNLFFMSVLLLCIAFSGCTKKTDSQMLEGIFLDTGELVLDIGEKYEFSVVTVPEDMDVDFIWVASDPSVASVENAVVTALSPGKSVITVTSEGKTATCSVFVSEEVVESVVLSQSELSLMVGESAHLSVEVYPENAEYTLVWSSGDNNIATVSGDGMVTAVAPGTVTVVAEAGGITDECVVTVMEAETIDANVGDYFYSDGTCSAELDLSKTVVGVVFYVGNVTDEDPALAADYPGCINGLVVSLEDISGEDGAGLAWQSGYGALSTSVNDWISSAQGTFAPVNDFTRALGYNNTKAIGAYNDANPEMPVEVVEEIASFNAENPAPDATSGWYLPSARELALLTAGEYDVEISDLSSCANLEVVNQVLGGIEDADKIQGYDMGFMVVPCYYWSSSEAGMTESSALYTSGEIQTLDKGVLCKIRTILAF